MHAVQSEVGHLFLPIFFLRFTLDDYRLLDLKQVA